MIFFLILGICLTPSLVESKVKLGEFTSNIDVKKLEKIFVIYNK